MKGQERKETREKLKKQLPSEMRHSDIENMDPDIFLDGSWQDLRSLSVYQKVRSEALSANDKHANACYDVFLRAINEPKDDRYIQNPNENTLIYLYSKQQINVLI